MTLNTGPIKPPFTEVSAQAKVQAAEDAWNTRNRDQFFTGRNAIRKFLDDKWQKELHYRLEKELWAWTENRISVRFIYEWQDAVSGHWFRTHGNEHWEFDEDGLMQRRDMSANDIPISADDRQIRRAL